MAAKKRQNPRKPGPPVLDATPVEVADATVASSSQVATTAARDTTTASAEMDVTPSPSAPASMRDDEALVPLTAAPAEPERGPRLRLPDRTEPGTDALAGEAPSVIDGPSQIDGIVGFDAGTESGLLEVTPDRVGVNLRAVAIGLLIGIGAGLVVVLILSNLVLQ